MRQSRRLLLAGSGALSVGVPVLLLWPMHHDLPEMLPRDTAVLPRLALLSTGAELKAPLFEEARLPPAERGKPESAASEKTPTAPPPELVGIAKGGGTGVALLRSAAGQTTQIRVGEQVDGWRLVALTRASATVERGAEHVELGFDLRDRARRTGADAATQQQASSSLDLSPLSPSIGPK